MVPKMGEAERADRTYEKFMPQMAAIILGCIAIHIPIYTHLVRKWAKE